MGLLWSPPPPSKKVTCGYGRVILIFLNKFSIKKENKNVIFGNIRTQQHDVGDIFIPENLYEILNVFRYFAVLKIYFCSLFSYL